MVYEFHCCERHKINKLIHRLTIEDIEYIQFSTNESANVLDERIVFVTEPNKIQKYLVKIYKFIDITTFGVIVLLAYFTYNRNTLKASIFTLVIYMIIGTLYKFDSIILIKLLEKFD